VLYANEGEAMCLFQLRNIKISMYEFPGLGGYWFVKPDQSC